MGIEGIALTLITENPMGMGGIKWLRSPVDFGNRKSDTNVNFLWARQLVCCMVAN